MNWKQNVLAVAAFVLVALPGYSQPATSGAQPAMGSSTTGTLNRTTMLLMFIHQANLDELEVANLAKQNSSSAEVKDFAAQIIKDHQSAEEKMAAFASSHNIDLAAVSKQMRAMRDQAAQRAAEERESRGVGSGTGEWSWMADQDTAGSDPLKVIANHNSEMDKLGTLKGAAFDREFAKTMVNDHQAIIGRLTTARTRVNDPDAVALVDKALPMAKQHLTMAQKLQTTVSKPS
jgi:putative membrane protein